MCDYERLNKELMEMIKAYDILKKIPGVLNVRQELLKSILHKQEELKKVKNEN